MPSHPPETVFYAEDENYKLWRVISRLYEEFCGLDETQWSERQEMFKTVVNDIIGRLENAGNHGKP